MELGFPPRRSTAPLAAFCSIVGAGVPIGTFLITWLASQTTNVPQDIWVAPSVVSVAAIIGVSTVAGIGFGRSDSSAQADPRAKPASDPDTIDFAGRVARR